MQERTLPRCSWRESIALRDIPLTRNGTIGFEVENISAAIAAAWSMDIGPDLIAAGIKTFDYAA